MTIHKHITENDILNIPIDAWTVLIGPEQLLFFNDVLDYLWSVTDLNLKDHIGFSKSDETKAPSHISSLSIYPTNKYVLQSVVLFLFRYRKQIQEHYGIDFGAYILGGE